MLRHLTVRRTGVPNVIHPIHGPSYHEHHAAYVHWGIKNLKRLFARLSDHFAAVADSLVDDFVRDKICARDRISTILSGIHFTAFPSDPRAARRSVREELHIDDGTTIVVSVGHLMKRKGHDCLVRAAGYVVAYGGKVVFLNLGTTVDVEDVKGPLQRQIEQPGLTDVVILCGARDDVPCVLAAADVYVQASWNEGLARRLVEAMYSGLPVVATDVNATSEVVREGDTGYLVPPGDAGVMGERLLQLLRSLSLRQTMGARARALVGSRSVEVMGSQLDTLYLRLAAGKGISR